MSAVVGLTGRTPLLTNGRKVLSSQLPISVFVLLFKMGSDLSDRLCCDISRGVWLPMKLLVIDHMPIGCHGNSDV